MYRRKKVRFFICLLLCAGCILTPAGSVFGMTTGSGIINDNLRDSAIY